jgi:hypothetical protein
VPEFLLVSSLRTVGKYLIAYGASRQRATVRVKGCRNRICGSSSGINTGLAPVATENGAVLSHSAIRPIAAGGKPPVAGYRQGRGGREGAQALAVCGPVRAHGLF